MMEMAWSVASTVITPCIVKWELINIIKKNY